MRMSLFFQPLMYVILYHTDAFECHVSDQCLAIILFLKVLKNVAFNVCIKECRVGFYNCMLFLFSVKKSKVECF